MVELEKVYDAFWVIDEEYETVVSEKEHADHQIVNGLDVSAFRANAKEVYTGARRCQVWLSRVQFPHLLIPQHIHQNKVLHYQYKELLRQKQC